MKYTYRFPNALTGDEVIPRSLFKGSQMRQCVICGDWADFVEMNYQSVFCSDECLAEEHRRYNELITGGSISPQVWYGQRNE